MPDKPPPGQRGVKGANRVLVGLTYIGIAAFSGLAVILWGLV